MEREGQRTNKTLGRAITMSCSIFYIQSPCASEWILVFLIGFISCPYFLNVVHNFAVICLLNYSVLLLKMF